MILAYLFGANASDSEHIRILRMRHVGDVSDLSYFAHFADGIRLTKAFHRNVPQPLCGTPHRSNSGACYNHSANSWPNRWNSYQRSLGSVVVLLGVEIRIGVLRTIAPEDKAE